LRPFRLLAPQTDAQPGGESQLPGSRLPQQQSGAPEVRRVIRQWMTFWVTHWHDDCAQPQFVYSRPLRQPWRLPQLPLQQNALPQLPQQSM
jgi:hypothetical protein